MVSKQVSSCTTPTCCCLWLIERVANTRIWDRLLLETDMTLAKATTLALQIETWLCNVDVLTDNTAAATPVRVIHSQPRNNWPREKNKMAPRTAHVTAPNAGKCRSCGSASQLANKQSCPAAKATCNSCGKMGHFAKVCRSGQKEVREVLINELTMLYMDNAVQDKIQCTVHVDADEHSHDVELVVDTGSSVSILPVSMYQNLFSTCELAKSTVTVYILKREKYQLLGSYMPQLLMRDIQLNAHLWLLSQVLLCLG